jgi:hypothetical protein
LHFDAASAPCFLRAAHLPASHADHEPLSAGTSLCAFGPTTFTDPGTPLFTPFRGRPTGFTLPAGGPAPRVWLPFQRPQFPDPWKRFSAPNVRGLRPSELFSGPMIGNRFPGPLPLSRFSTRPIDLVPAPQRLPPIEPAVPLIAPRVFSSGRGQVALLGLLTSRALPPLDRSRASLPTLPLSLLNPHDLSIA